MPKYFQSCDFNLLKLFESKQISRIVANLDEARNEGRADSDEQSPVPKKEQLQKSKTFDYRSNNTKNKIINV